MSLKPIKVFVVEDSGTSRRAVRSALQNVPGMEIIGEAMDGPSALDAVGWLKPDLVLMDIGLPGMDGIAVTRKLREELPDLKVIMVTCRETDDSIFDAFAAGANGYHLKSSPQENLQLAVRAVMNGTSWLDPELASRVLRSCAHQAEKLVDGTVQAFVEQSFADKTPEGAPGGTKSASAPASGDEPLDPPVALLAMAVRYEALEKFAEAETVLTQALALSEKLFGDATQQKATLMTRLADFHCRRGQYDKARSLYQDALKLRHTILGAEHLEVASSLESLGDLYKSESDHAKAERYYLLSLKIKDKNRLAGEQPCPETYNKLAWVYRAQGKLEEATCMEERARELSAR